MSLTPAARRARLCLPLFLCASIAMPLAAFAQSLKSGEQVYKETCFACHNTKFDKAPQFGDKTVWAPLIKEGQHVLTAHAWVGVRNMPPKGGKADLSLEEFGRAVAYMARASGGTWKDPDAAMMKRIQAEEKARIAALKSGKAKP